MREWGTEADKPKPLENWLLGVSGIGFTILLLAGAIQAIWG